MKSIIRHSLLLLFVILLMPGMTNAKKIQRAEFRCTLDDFHISYKDSLVRVSGRLMRVYQNYIFGTPSNFKQPENSMN